jgi:hypothetical protein
MAKPRRWSEADLDNSSQDSTTSEACVECSQFPVPASRISPSCYTSRQQYSSKPHGSSMLKRRAVCLTP